MNIIYLIEGEEYFNTILPEVENSWDIKKEELVLSQNISIDNISFDLHSPNIFIKN